MDVAGLTNAEAGNHNAALKEAFLKTDEDLRAGQSRPPAVECRSTKTRTYHSDPNFFNDPSGCTAVVGLLANNKFIVVRGFAVDGRDWES